MFDAKEINKLLKLPAKKHQVFGANYALQKYWSINGFLMGHGKSLIAVIIATITGLNTVIVCPAFLKINWEREFIKFSLKKLKIKILYSKDIDGFEPTDENVVILNYTIVKRAEKVFKWAQFICCDESHFLGNPSAQRTKAVFKFCIKYKPERLLLMSGSPIKGRVGNWYVPVKLTGANPRKTSGKSWEPRYVAFQDKFSQYRMVSVGARTFKKYYGLKNEGELRDLLKDKFLRKCPDYELELPDLSFESMEVDYKVDDTELQALFAEFEGNRKMSDHLSSAKKSNALLKVPFTFKFVENIIASGEGPVVVYSDHPMVLEELGRLFDRKKITHTSIHGGTPIDKRQKHIDAFQANKTDVFLATIGAASTGITLTAANKLIFNDRSWVNVENEQALKRIHRISQTRHCIIYSIFSGKVDKMISKVIREKDMVVRKTVDF